MFDINKVDRIVEMFIFDIYIAILKIKKTASKFNNVQDLLYSYTDWDSVIREFEIMGEASKHLLKNKLLDKNYQKVVDFRNQITHEYFGIDQDIVWIVIHNELDNYQYLMIDLINEIDKALKIELIEAFIEDNGYLDFIVKKLEKLR